MIRHAFVVSLLLTGCGGDDGPPPGSHLPPSWTLSAPGVTVEISREPYGYVVRDGSGEEVLRTAAADVAERDEGDGYAPVAWTTGSIIWRIGGITKGHYGFAPQFDPWREDWVVVEATESDGMLELELREGGHGADLVRVRYQLRDSTLRVETTVEGTTPRAIGTSFSSAEDEGFLGLGERYTRTNFRGASIYSWAEEGGVGSGEGNPPGLVNPTPNGESMTYYPVPFFLSTNGYAFWLDTTWRSSFDFATDHSDTWRVWEIGPSTAYEIYLPIEDDERPWPYQLIDQFTATTGRPMLPPEWTYGPRRRINRNDMQGAVSEIQAMRDMDLAITALDDSVHFLPRGSHVGDEEVLRSWVAEGHRLGYRMNCYYNSLISADEENPLRDVLLEGVDNGYFLLDDKGEVSEVELISGSFVPVYQIDFTNPEATAWFQAMFDWATDLDYDGFMYDFGEYVQPKTLASDGMTGEELHNLYPVLYDRAVFEHLEAGPKAGEWLAFARSGYTGSSQYVPMVWAGDPAASFEESDGLPSMVPAGLNLSISGAPNWGGDIGGFHCASDGATAADGELMARWIQQGALTPNMQDQDACSLSLDDGEKASIWTSPEAMESWRVYARLHTRLFPYHWTLAQLATERGEPIMRHVFLEHPERADLASEKTVYYYGPGLFVAPVLQRGALSRTVSFPPGRFLDWRDFTVYEGDTEATVDAPLTELPLFLRDGHLIPLLDPSIDTLSDETNDEVIGRGDVADVYDVVGFISAETGGASFTVFDAGPLTVTWTGGLTAPTGTEVTDEAELADCADVCFLIEDLGDGLSRVRITHGGSMLTSGGLTVQGDVGRRVRWDLFVRD